MKSLSFLRSCYDLNNNQILAYLEDEKSLKCLLEQDSTLIIFVRYLQNMYQLDYKSLLRTLLLLISLAKLNQTKICDLLPFKKINLSSLSKSTKIKGFQAQVLEKIINYANYLIAFQNHFEIPLQEELQILTKDLHHFYQKLEAKELKIIQELKIYYWMAEDRLYKLWMSINHHYINYQLLQYDQFQEFYDKYTLFCKYKRKIPKIKHKSLKSIEITYNINKMIEERCKELLGHLYTSQESNCHYIETGISSEIKSRMINLIYKPDEEQDD